MQLLALQSQGLSVVVHAACATEAAESASRARYLYVQQACHQSSFLPEVRLCSARFRQGPLRRGDRGGERALPRRGGSVLAEEGADRRPLLLRGSAAG